MAEPPISIQNKYSIVNKYGRFLTHNVFDIKYYFTVEKTTLLTNSHSRATVKPMAVKLDRKKNSLFFKKSVKLKKCICGRLDIVK